ncbi:helix-turn-helix transcriptional regulator [Ruficoccus amylovorans]|uniref:Helix-turn-helix transcriptional regulator n=1 Tax=Ruficoccus amylovorans TaxID=1804625 RepID=A0A842HGP4_9BACT|nr:AraC family transcriptional regulator [Ruficoccus amylovorans]MBC2595875.1 helix-turn-helix transcriptional regulator [Ruficoccus amylovorans]
MNRTTYDHIPYGWGIRVIHQDHTRLAGWWNGQPLYNDYWRLYYNFSEGATIRLSSKTFEIPAHCATLIPSGLQATGYVEGGFMHYFVHFHVMGLPMALQGKMFPEPIHARPCKHIDGLVEQWSTLANDEDPRDVLPSYFLAESISAYVFAQCWHIHSINLSTDWRLWRNHPSRLTRLHSWMENRLDEDLSVNRLAEQTGYSRDHFRRVFLEVYGVNPAEYVTQLRVREMTHLLLSSHYTIDEIAERTGMVDRHHMSRVFRKISGESPASYRKKNQFILNKIQ